MNRFHKEEFQGQDEYRKFFNFIKKPTENAIYRTDFMPFMKALLESHPGLDFLKSHPDFQDKYSDTVIMRIFYSCDLNDDGKLVFRYFSI
jgi:serine/threonine-protein phosphatase 2A regulatory subunit B''